MNIMHFKKSGRVEISDREIQKVRHFDLLTWYIYEKLVASGAPISLNRKNKWDVSAIRFDEIVIEDGFMIDRRYSQRRQVIVFKWKRII